MAQARLVHIWRWLVRLVSLTYLIALIAVVAAFRLVGEGWWVTTAGLYLPRLGFALPLPFLTLALALDRSWRWLLTQLAALIVILFPLMGLHLSLGRTPTPGAPRFRILTFNVDSGREGLDGVLARVRAADADVIAIQESGYADLATWRAGLPGYTVDRNGQFVLASRFPIEDRFDPPPLSHEGRMRTPRFQRYRIAAPGGPIQLYSVHPISPRESLDDLRGEGLRQEITSKRILHPATQEVTSAAALRTAQMQAVVDDAARSPYPVIIAGDTNLPEQSRSLAHTLRGLQDAFAEVGVGFGYTYPNSHHGPWMRIDRIVAGTGLRFLDCRVMGKPLVSDHRPVVADVEVVSGSR